MRWPPFNRTFEARAQRHSSIGRILVSVVAAGRDDGQFE